MRYKDCPIYPGSQQRVMLTDKEAERLTSRTLVARLFTLTDKLDNCLNLNTGSSALIVPSRMVLLGCHGPREFFLRCDCRSLTNWFRVRGPGVV